MTVGYDRLKADHDKLAASLDLLISWMEGQTETNAGLIDLIDALECRVSDLEEGWEA